MNKKFIFLVTIITAIALTFGSCMAPRRPEPAPENQTPNYPQTPVPSPIQTPVDPNVPDPTVPPTGQPQNGDEALAERIRTFVNQMQDVNQTFVVVLGSTALIGVDINEANRGPVDEALKEEIATQVRNQEQGITEVYVTADPNLITRIRRLADSLAEGRPVTGLINEVWEIMQKIRPTTPQ